MHEVLSYEDWQYKRLGRFTSSCIYKLFSSGTRPMTEDELKEEKKNGGRRKTVDILFGPGAITYIEEKVDELLSMEIKEEQSFEATMWGKEKEFEAYQDFEKQTGIKGEYYGVHNPQFFTYGEYAGGSPDWEGEDAVADFKAPFNGAIHLKHMRLKNAAELKDKFFDYYSQIQCNMYIRKKKKGYFVSYNPRRIEDKYKRKIIELFPDQEWIDEYEFRLAAATQEINNILNEIS